MWACPPLRTRSSRSVKADWWRSFISNEPLFNAGFRVFLPFLDLVVGAFGFAVSAFVVLLLIRCTSISFYPIKECTLVDEHAATTAPNDPIEAVSVRIEDHVP